MEYEAPKRFTAVNDVTGALIKSKSDNQDAYSTGYDILKSGNVSKEQPETKFPVLTKIRKNELDLLKRLADKAMMPIESYIEQIIETHLYS